MTGTSASRHERLQSLPEDRAQLLRLLMRERAQQARAIKPYSRSEGGDSLRAPLSWAQQRLWFIDQLEGSSVAYHRPVVIRMRGELDCAALQSALDVLQSRHEVLHTAFVVQDGQTWQEIAADAPFELKTIDLSRYPSAEQEARLQRLRAEEVHRLFDLRAGQLIRGQLVRLGAEEHVLLITLHHIASDGWSIGILIGELTELYSAYRTKRIHSLQPLPIQYSDYARWQRDWLEGAELERQLAYWRLHLAGAEPQLELPTDRPRPAVQSYRGANLAVALPADLCQDLRGLAQRHQMTLFMVLQTAWAILLSRISGQRDVLVGTPIANRQRPELEGLIGFFANTLVLRTDVQEETRLRDLLAQVKEVTLAAYDHQDAPFEKIVEAVQPQRSLSRNPLFQVMFVLQNAPKSELHLPGLNATLAELGDEPAMFDLLMSLEERDQYIAGTVNYAVDLFDRSTIERWTRCYLLLLRGMVVGEDMAVGALPMLPEEERRRVVEIFNATETPYPDDKLVHQLFEEQVLRTPDAVAVEHESRSLTYQQLNRKANQLARLLVAKGVGPDRVVAVCLGRTPEMVIALLGILKAGGAYMPLDPNYPVERLQHMVSDAAPALVLTQRDLRAMLPDAEAELLEVDSLSPEIATCADDNLTAQRGLDAGSLTYVIYTSGSTGRPKGTAMPHRAMVNLTEWHRHAFVTRRAARVLQFAALSFDVAFQETFSTLCTGGTLVLIDEWVRRDARALCEFLSSRSIERLFLPPVMLQTVAEHAIRAGAVPGTLRDVIVAGEQLQITPDIVAFFRQAGDCRLHNHYGPTETHVVTALTLEGAASEWPTLPSIGRPIANSQIYVLSGRRDPVAVGVSGEIYIGGANVARGYLGRPQLTAERFVTNPFSADPTARLYRTGDMGRWRADGTLEYLGRNDDQVKIRGFRIELGEIEAQLARDDRVREAVVVARDNAGEKCLVAYVTPRAPGNLRVDELREHAKSRLPEQMVPTAFVVLENLPLTPSGKVDRRALPAPGLDAYVRRDYEAPRGDVEPVLAKIWQELLRVQRVGRHDNFFELGGHSLLIVQMLERLRRSGLTTSVRSVYQSRTLAELARNVLPDADDQVAVPANRIVSGCTTIAPDMLPLVQLDPEHIERIVEAVPGGSANIQDIYPLTSLQEGMLFHHLLSDTGGDTYVLPLLLEISSRRRVEQFVEALQAIIDRHDILRTAAMWEQLPQAVQVVYRRATLPVEELVLDRDRDALEQLRECIAPQLRHLDLRRAPLMRLQLAEDPSGRHWYAILQLHHFVCDKASLDTMLAEVMAYLDGRAGQLPEPMPYRNHVAQMLAHSRANDAEEFFQRKLGDIDEPTAPFGLVDVRGDGSRIAQARTEVDVALALRLRAQARRLSVSAAALVHAAWALVVARTSGREDIVFGSVLLGRHLGRAGAQRILGMFINTLPLRIDLGGLSARRLAERMQEELATLLQYEQCSLAVAQRCSGISGSAPLFSALLNYRHAVREFRKERAGADGVRLLASHGLTNYPVTLSVDDLDEEFILTAQTDCSVDPGRFLAYVSTAMHALVEALEHASYTPALTLEVLPATELIQILQSFNETARPIPSGRLVHELFEEVAQRTPAAIAIEYASDALSYSQLNARANRLARCLRSRGACADRPVAICLPRGLDMVVGLMAVLKAGAAYLPLDPSYPPERLKYMLEDASPSLVLTNMAVREALPATSADVIVLDGMFEKTGHLEDPNISPAEIGSDSHSVVYVIYTSGSTGRPKGTVMEHRSMVNLIEWHRQTFADSEGRRVLQFAALSFDVAFQEIFTTLCTGGTLVLLDESIRRDAHALSELLAQRSIERLFVPPLMLQTLAEHAATAHAVPTTLRDIITAGEQLRVTPQIVSFFERLGGCQLHNHYGPTETHVVTALTLHGHPSQWPALPSIGRPIANARIYLLDARRKPVPLGVTGEVYIGGAGVARGYLNRPDLTTERFMRDPFSSDVQARLYKTGDLGRYLPDGTIEYIGRNDNQVKIRGFRIELGEIEAQLSSQTQVKEAVVIAREDAPGQKRLVAYLTVRGDTPPSVEALRSHLVATLPEHMVPSACVVLECLPLTPSGKLDRRALPAPELGAYASRQYEPPEGEVEEALASIWQDLLQVERVGRRDDFFELGGHSLLAIRLVVRVADRLSVNLGVSAVFRYPSVWSMAEFVESLKTARPSATADREDLEGGVI